MGACQRVRIAVALQLFAEPSLGALSIGRRARDLCGHAFDVDAVPEKGVGDGGADADILGVFASFMIASVAASIGPTPLGLGTFESACVATLALVGVRLELALTATLLLRGLTFWLPMLPGLRIARRELRSS